MSPRVAIAITLAALTLCASTAAQADESAFKPTAVIDLSKQTRKGPAVLVSFEGGLVGDDIASVLDILARAKSLPTTSYVVQSQDTVCTILASTGYPPPCTKLIPFIASLNPSISPPDRPLRLGETLIVPDIQIRVYSTSKSISHDSRKDQQTQAQIQKNWQELAPEVKQQTSRSSIVQYRAYEVLIPTRSDDASRDIMRKVLRGTDSKNILVDMLSESRNRTSSAYAAAGLNADQFKTKCKDGTITSISYRDYFDPDVDALPVLKPPAQLAKIGVYIIDAPIAESPNLYPAYGGAQGQKPWVCKWLDDVPTAAHATHLASIVASQDNAFGFIGLAPNVEISSVAWVRPDANGVLRPVSDDRDIALAETINEVEHNGPPLTVYLSAVGWDLPTEVAQFVDKENRFRSRLPKTVHEVRPLMIVAAGQSATPNQALQLSPESVQFPQNLGDLENVIVVSACSDCSQTTPKIMDGAWYPSGTSKSVHVAAPGGVPVPGWIGTDAVGASRGTSQAAAFVAGTAASMIGAYPLVYFQAKLVKTRIQATSRPMPWYENNDAMAEGRKVTAGVVDPVLAMLDPSKHWIKQQGNWSSVKVRKFLPKSISYRDGQGFAQAQPARAVLRMVRASVGGAPGWAMYVDPSFSGDSEPGEVHRLYVSSFSAGPPAPQLVLCDGTVKAISDLQDILLSTRGVVENDCAN